MVEGTSRNLTECRCGLFRLGLYRLACHIISRFIAQAGEPRSCCSADAGPVLSLPYESILREVPCLISVIELEDEQIVFQNAMAKTFFASLPPAGFDGASYLSRLFSLQEEDVKKVDISGRPAKLLLITDA